MPTSGGTLSQSERRPRSRSLAKNEPVFRHYWTGSATARVRACPASAVMEQVLDVTLYDGREWGTGIHNFLYLYAKYGQSHARLSVVGMRWEAYCRALSMDAFFDSLGDRVFYELAFAYNPETGKSRPLGENIGRHYPSNPDEVCLTPDVVSIDGKSALVIDYKTGQPDGRAAHERGQMLLAACAVAQAFDLEQVTLRIMKFGHEPGFESKETTLTKEELDKAGASMRETYREVRKAYEALVQGELPPLAIGPHCATCPCFRLCPAQNELAWSLGGMSETTDAWRTLLDRKSRPTSDSAVADAWLRLLNAKRVLETAEAYLRKYIKETGSVSTKSADVALCNYQRESIDAKKALPVLRDIFGESVDSILDVLDVQVTKTAIKKMCDELDYDENEVFSTLREMGACLITDQEQIRVRSKLGERPMSQNDDLLPVGRYNAKAVSARPDRGQNGTEYIRMTFRVTDGDYEDSEVEWIGFLTQNAGPRTIESLRTLGFEGYDIDEFIQGVPTTTPNTVSITVEHNEYKGHVSARVRWINRPMRQSGPTPGGGLSADARALARALLMESKPNGQQHRTTPASALRSVPSAPLEPPMSRNVSRSFDPAKTAPPKPSAPAYAATGTDDDDDQIPFLKTGPQRRIS